MMPSSLLKNYVTIWLYKDYVEIIKLFSLNGTTRSHKKKKSACPRSAKWTKDLLAILI